MDNIKTCSKVNTFKISDLVMGIILFGSLWGLSEAVIGDLIRTTGIPFRAGILTGIGIGILGAALGLYRMPAVLPLIALTTALSKQLVVPILGFSLLCKANSCAALLLLGFSVTGMTFLTGSHLKRSTFLRAATALSAVLIAAFAFYFIGMRLAPCAYLLSFAGAGGLQSFMFREGLVWALFAALLFPAGYRLGERMRDDIVSLRVQKPAWFYATSGVLIAGSWLALVLSIATGM